MKYNIKKYQTGNRISQEEIDKANANKSYISPQSNITPEARTLNTNINRDTSISNTIKDMGTGAITMGTQFRFPTSEEIQQGRGSWRDRMPLLMSGITEGLKNEMLGAGVVKGAQTLGKGIQTYNNIINNLQKENLKKLVYNNITPASYTNKKSEIKQIIKDIINTDIPKIKQEPIRNYPNDIYGLDNEIIAKNREEAWKKYLNIPDPKASLYIQNSNGTYSYNPERISDVAYKNFLNQNFNSGSDLLTSNAGGVGKIDIIPSNYSDVSFAKMKDVWDLQPFKNPSYTLVSDSPILNKLFLNPLSKEAKEKFIKTGEMKRSYRNWVPDKFKNLEIGEFLGIGKPFTVEHYVPFKTTIIDFNSNNPAAKVLTKTLAKETDRILYKKPPNIDFSKFNIDFNKSKINNIDLSNLSNKK